MNPSKAKRRANRNKHKHRDQAARRKTGAEKRPEQLELPVSMPERGAAESELQAKTKDSSQHKTKASAKTDPASSPRFQVASRGGVVQPFVQAIFFYHATPLLSRPSYRPNKILQNTA